jgi:hypothetical protein
MTRNRSNPRRGFMLAEVSVAAVLVAFMLIATMEALRGAIVVNVRAGKNAQANNLANALLAEILAQKYVDPGASPVFGPEAGESTGTRSAFEDVDDYNGWNESPPQSKSGAPLSYLGNWRRSVIVAYVDPANTNTVLQTDQGAKRITVTVQFRGTTLATSVGVRTNVNL